jgi:hypothetical protein
MDRRSIAGRNEAAILVVVQVAAVDRRRQPGRFDVEDRVASKTRSERFDLDDGARIAGLADGLQHIEPRQCRFRYLIKPASDLPTRAGLVEHHGGVPRSRDDMGKRSRVRYSPRYLSLLRPSSCRGKPLLSVPTARILTIAAVRESARVQKSSPRARARPYLPFQRRQAVMNAAQGPAAAIGPWRTSCSALEL